MKIKFFLLALLALPTFIPAMDAPAAKAASLEILPRELQEEIVLALASGDSLPKAINSILALGMAKRAFVTFLKDSLLNKYLISELIKKFPQETGSNYFVAGLKLGTQGALGWLKEFAQKNPEIAKKMISEALSFAVGQPQPDTQLLVRLVDAGYATERQIKELLRYKIMQEFVSPTRTFFLSGVDAYIALFGPKTDEMVNMYGQTFLYRLANNPTPSPLDLSLMRELIARGVNINAKDIHGRSLLTNVVIMGAVPVVKILLENGADVNAKDEKNYSALQIAQYEIEGPSTKWREKYQQIINLLKQYGAQ